MHRIVDQPTGAEMNGKDDQAPVTTRTVARLENKSGRYRDKLPCKHASIHCHMKRFLEYPNSEKFLLHSI